MTRTLRRLAVIGLTLLALPLAACGSDDSSAAKAAAPTRTERAYNAAVLKAARVLYFQEHIVNAECHKVGFSPGADTISCTLLTSDGSVTQSSEWTAMRNADGSYLAIPAGA